ncbi:MAG: cyclopropane-fatty-acyl-phospholipid synthase family protein [Lentisphaeraceae bacterium]|nr:cyclopropane-fatty-acyl-phospholipid synthase family protein [Lentisphaeraceae bacterium]
MSEVQLATKRFSLPQVFSVPDKWAKKLFLKFLEKMTKGYLIVKDSNSVNFFGDVESDLHVTLEIKDDSAYADFLVGGSLGAGESYIRGEWDCSSLTDLIRLFARNMQLVESMDSGLAKIGSPVLRTLHWMNRNTKSGSRKNIEAHYDLGNDFFQLFLDESMMYSSAIFENENTSLTDAQQHKLKTICEKLNLNENDHLLEIGTGWGAMAIYAAENYGCKVTTTTISKEQYALAKERIREKNLDDKIDLLLMDYRELKGTYSKVVSIEMVEAVGHEYLEEYFQKCSDLTAEDGLFLMQVITIPDQRYDSARKEIDFIKRYIFPGSCIPSIEKISKCIRNKTDYRLVDMDEYAWHYAHTLKLWHENLLKNEKQIKEKFSAEFMRMWRFYFSYCEGGFFERVIGSSQMLFAKPFNREITRS